MIAENVVVKGVVRSSDGCQAHYVASDPRASYTLIDPATSLQSYNPSALTGSRRTTPTTTCCRPST